MSATFFPGERRAIDFGAVTPGDVRKSVLLVATSTASVTARIDGGGGRFRVATVVCQGVSLQQLTPDEIAQLPPHMRKDPRFHVSVERSVVGTSDGVTPLEIQEGQEIAVHVGFRGEDRAGEGVQSATLSINGAGWKNPISVPLSALVGHR